MAVNTGQTEAAIAKDTERDNFMSADEALRYGLIDKVIERRVDTNTNDVWFFILISEEHWLKMSKDENGTEEGAKLLYCSFCGKSQHEVRKLIAGPSVFVCDECVDLCNDIIREETQEDPAEGPIRRLPNPEEIKENLETEVQVRFGVQTVQDNHGGVR